MKITTDIKDLNIHLDDIVINFEDARYYDPYENIVFLYICQQITNYIYENIPRREYIENINLISEHNLLNDKIDIDYESIHRLKELINEPIDNDYILNSFISLSPTGRGTITMKLKLEDPKTICLDELKRYTDHYEWLFALDNFCKHFNHDDISVEIAQDLHRDITMFKNTKNAFSLRHINYYHLICCLQTINYLEAERISANLTYF